MKKLHTSPITNYEIVPNPWGRCTVSQALANGIRGYTGKVRLRGLK